ncbi:MAG: hypothetical protein AVDCRST_MAG49-3924, partial [uncultured Thermomicrobiales bacterium]
LAEAPWRQATPARCRTRPGDPRGVGATRPSAASCCSPAWSGSSSPWGSAPATAPPRRGSYSPRWPSWPASVCSRRRYRASATTAAG